MEVTLKPDSQTDLGLKLSAYHKPRAPAMTEGKCLAELELLLESYRDHVRNVKTAYSHHMLVVEVVSKTRLLVIHYTARDPHKVAGIPDSMQATGVSSLGAVFSSGSGSAVQGVAMVIEEQIELDPTTETIEIITYSAKIAVYPADKAISRARTKIGEQAYHLFNNNCESFVNWALTGEAESKQGDFAKVALIGAGAAVGIGIGVALTVGVLRALSGKKK